MRKETEAIVNQKSRTEWLELINEWVHNEQDRKIYFDMLEKLNKK